LWWIGVGTVVAVLVAAPFLLPLGAVGGFLLSCLALVGIIALGERQDQLHREQDQAIFLRGELRRR
jgi:hypothetical protein